MASSEAKLERTMTRVMMILKIVSSSVHCLTFWELELMSKQGAVLLIPPKVHKVLLARASSDQLDWHQGERVGKRRNCVMGRKFLPHCYVYITIISFGNSTTKLALSGWFKLLPTLDQRRKGLECTFSGR